MKGFEKYLSKKKRWIFHVSPRGVKHFKIGFSIGVQQCEAHLGFLSFGFWR